MQAKHNPYDWNNPVVDRKLFAGRREELTTIEEQIARLASASPIVPMVAIIGERRVGKTSTLRRVEEMCHQHGLANVIISLEDRTATDSWEFWHEVLSRLLIAARNIGILIPPIAEESIGFHINSGGITKQTQRGVVIRELWFPNAYSMHLSASQPIGLADYLLANDLRIIVEAFLKADYKGLLLILDEAHLLEDAREIKQQLRHVANEVGRCGIVFAGEPRLSHMFTDSSEPFYGQARVVPLKNFTDIDDVAECVLLPLNDDERKLLNPMTVDYLARLTLGKPNLIRLTCYSIYSRYMRGEQAHLDITIDVLDDVIDILEETFHEGEMRKQAENIGRLSSVDLELLYDITRYPNWPVDDIVNLDECFRGEAKSELAIARRRRGLDGKREHFIRLGLIVDETDRCSLKGGEFLHLYLRFLHEVRKYGKLSRRLVLGKPPSTPFGEKTEKLVRSVAYTLGERPEIGRYIFHTYYRDEGNIVETIKRRFSILNKIVKGEHPKAKDISYLVSECADVCQLVGKAGVYYLLCLSVRNLDSPRELMQIELYFNSHELRAVDLPALFNVVNHQTYDAKVLIEGYDGFLVELPDLESLLGSIGALSLNELMEKLDLVEQWRLSSVHHLVKSAEVEKERELERAEEQAEDIEEGAKWISMYGSGYEKEAEEFLNKKLEKAQERTLQARLYNDRGYIRYGAKIGNTNLAKKDLETALHLYFFHLPLVLLNLSCIDIDEEQYEPAIRKIEDTLMLISSRMEIEASYLRLRLPENHLNFKVKWEQHPANLLEASYINLAYTTLKGKSYQEALDVLHEGLQLIPSSARLKHALARLHLYRKRADLALPIYSEISKIPTLDEGIKLEIGLLSRGLASIKRKRRKR